MNRRTALKAMLASGTAMIAPGALAQAPGRIWRVGYLGPSAETAPHLLKAFREGLAAFGYVEGRNLVVEYRWTNSGVDMTDEKTMIANIRDLVAHKVDVIVASIDPAIVAARKGAGSIPIVMLNASDPVELGFADSLARPGRNITGMTRIVPELIGKNLQVLLEMVPKARTVGLLVYTSTGADHSIVTIARQAAQARGVTLQVVEARDPTEFATAFDALKRGRADALLVANTGSGLFFTQRVKIAELALAQRLPSIFGSTENVVAGGLMSYSPSSVANYLRAGAFIDKILRGAKAGDIPIEQPTTFELAINLKTAKALGLVVPKSLLMREPQLIE